MSSDVEHFWGPDQRYRIDIDGGIEERDPQSTPQVGNVPRFVAQEMIRLANFERDHLNPLTEDQLRAALIAGETDNLISIVPPNLAFCDQCDRYNDTRSGCETDIRFDETQRIRLELIDWLIGRINPKDAGLINGRRIVDEIDRICPKE